MHIDGPELSMETQCEKILRSLPEWFGIEESLIRYARDTVRLPTFAASGFLRLEVFPELWQRSNPCLQMVKLLRDPI